MHDWDLVERHIPPACMTLALSKEEARAQLVRQAVTNAPLCTAREIALLFGWERNLAGSLGWRASRERRAHSRKS